jgi:5,10-methylenetetrahydrofolate reductase
MRIDRLASLEPLFIDVTWGAVRARGVPADKPSRMLVWSTRVPPYITHASITPHHHTDTSRQGGSTAELTLQIAANCQRYLGQEVLMHLTCTNLSVDKIKEALREVCVHVSVYVSQWAWHVTAPG